jgi:hypothetical protein
MVLCSWCGGSTIRCRDATFLEQATAVLARAEVAELDGVGHYRNPKRLKPSRPLCGDRRPARPNCSGVSTCPKVVAG